MYQEVSFRGRREESGGLAAYTRAWLDSITWKEANLLCRYDSTLESKRESERKCEREREREREIGEWRKSGRECERERDGGREGWRERER